MDKTLPSSASSSASSVSAGTPRITLSRHAWPLKERLTTFVVWKYCEPFFESETRIEQKAAVCPHFRPFCAFSACCKGYCRDRMFFFAEKISDLSVILPSFPLLGIIDAQEPVTARIQLPT